MKKEDIHWADWHRILIGTAPDSFLLEVFFRSVILFLFLLFILRLMGKRMGGMLTMSELAIMLTLGAIVCLPMQIPDRGIFHGFLVLICALLFERWFNYIGVKSSSAEKIIHGEETILLKDGVLMCGALRKSNISKQQLYAVLRSKEIKNLGQLERIYLEASGLFSIFPFKEPRPGLSLFPSHDQEVHDIQQRTPLLVCCDCGNVKADNNNEKNCSNCGASFWDNAIL